MVERDGIVAKVYSPSGVDIGRRLLSAGQAYRRYSTDYVAAENEPARSGAGCGGQLRQALGVARITGHAGTLEGGPDVRPQAVSGG